MSFKRETLDCIKALHETDAMLFKAIKVVKESDVAELKQVAEKLDRTIKAIEPLLIRDGNLEERLREMEKDVKRTWDYLGIVKVPTDKPLDTHTLEHTASKKAEKTLMEEIANHNSKKAKF